MKIYITRNIPGQGIKMLQDKGYEVDINPKDRVLAKDELIKILKKKQYHAVLCLLTDKIDGEVMDAAPNAKIFANYAVGFDNIDIEAAKKRGVMVSNTPDVLNEAVAEHAVALMLAVGHRIPEADVFTRKGKYKGWTPTLLLGNGLFGKTVGIVGLGRIGSRAAHMVSNGFGAKVVYYDIRRNESFEKEFPTGAIEFKASIDEVLREADFVSLHLPLNEVTRKIIDTEKLKLMKPSAFLINTSRGPIVDELALVEALKNKTIKGAALDVFENEPKLANGLAKLENIVLTPHIASATEEVRGKMSEMAARNIIEAVEGRIPPNLIK
ncbi:MAG: D-glycerate dehydrogenase [Candidatus Paceibacter sp.]|nr:D-glycerate dehydrogenase [Candidatus Paceibacter sp.]